MFAEYIIIAGCTFTLELIDVIPTRGTVLTWHRSALVDVGLTDKTAVTGWTRARKSVDFVITSTTH
jgi:hypothetical protein